MITHNTMYDFHNVELQTRIESTKKEIEDLQERKDRAITYFKSSLCPIVLTQDQITNQDLKEIDNPDSNPKKYYNLKVNQYKELCTLLDNKKEVLNKLLKYKIPQGVFSFILKRFNELLYKEMIYNKYVFSTLFLGKLDVICNKNKHKVINWKVSIDNRNKLLSEGKVPYTKEGERKALEAGLDYKAEQWLEYLPEHSFFFNWDLQVAQFIRLPNIRNFTFVPVRGLASPVAELVKFKNSFKTEEEAINFYKTN